MITKKYALLILILVICISGKISADSFSVVCGGDTLNFQIKHGYFVELTQSNKYSGDITIPSSVTYNNHTYFVKGIGNYAFNGCTGLTSIVIPNTIDSIKVCTFLNCNNLKSVSLPNTILIIGEGAFKGCSKLTSIDIPNSVCFIGDYAFYGCSSLTSLIIPNHIKNIDDYTFYGCSSLDTFNFPEDLLTIGDYAFFGCSSLDSITIPKLVTTIGDYAFSNCTNLSIVNYNATNCNTSKNYPIFKGCSSLTTLNIGLNVNRIFGYAFKYCNGLSIITIPDSVTYIGDYAFSNCTNLTTVNYNAISCQLHNPVFDNCTSFSILNIGSHVEAISSYAFMDCKDLTTVNFNATNCTNMGYSYGKYFPVFMNCISLTKINIGSNVNTIPNSAFSGFNSLKDTLIIPNSVKYIGDSAFTGNSELIDIIISENVTYIGKYAFAGCTGCKGSLIIPNSVSTIGYSAFSGLSKIESISLPFIGKDESASSKYTYLFGYIFGSEIYDGCESTQQYYEENHVFEYYIPKKLVTVNITKGKIPFGAFSNCKNIKTITFSDSLNSSIGDYAFYNCTSLLLVNLGKSINCIGQYAFKNCWHLLSITFPDSLRLIKDFAFLDSKIDSINVSPNNLWFKSMNGVLYNYIMDTLIYCPEGKTEIVPIFNGTKHLKRLSFFNSNLTAISIIDSVISIGDSAFFNCNKLTNITLPKTIIDIGDFSFYECVSLNEIICKAIIPPNTGTDLFLSVPKNIPVYVPCGTTENYRTIKNWKDFTNIQEMGENIVRLNVNNSLYGYINYIQTLCESDTIIFEAINYPNYKFIRWNDNDIANPRSLIPTQDTTFTAIFDIDNSIEQTLSTLSPIVVYTNDKNIIITNATNKTVKIIDVMGRCIISTKIISDMDNFFIPVSGVYFVKIENNIVKKVILL